MFILQQYNVGVYEFLQRQFSNAKNGYSFLNTLLTSFLNLLNHIFRGKPENVETAIPDFDGANYYLVNKSDNKNIILVSFLIFDPTYDWKGTPFHSIFLQVSLAIGYYKELESHGCDDFLRSEYAGYIEPHPYDKQYNVTLSFDLTKLPDDTNALALKAAHLKRNCFASVFYKYFDLQSKLEKGEVANHTRAVIHFRPEETL